MVRYNSARDLLSDLFIRRRCLRRLSAAPLVGRWRACAEDDAHGVARAVVCEWNVVCGQRLAVKLDARDAATHAERVLDFDLVVRRLVPIVDLIVAPARRDTRVYHQAITLQLEAEH